MAQQASVSVEKTTLRLPSLLHEAIRTEAFRTRRPMQAIITEQLAKRYASDPLFFGSSPEAKDHVESEAPLSNSPGARAADAEAHRQELQEATP